MGNSHTYEKNYEALNPYSIQKFCLTYLSIPLYLISKDQDFIYIFYILATKWRGHIVLPMSVIP